MPVELQERHGGKVLHVTASGKLTRQDYQQLGPDVERLIKQQGKIRILLEMHDFHGWGPAGLWEDIKFDVRHFNDIERLAMVGEAKWQEGMAKVCKPFTTATIKFYKLDEAEEAWEWIEEGLPVQSQT